MFDSTSVQRLARSGANRRFDVASRMKKFKTSHPALYLQGRDGSRPLGTANGDAAEALVLLV